MACDILYVPGEQALATIEARWRDYSKTHEYPFIVGGSHDMGIIDTVEEMEEGQFEAIIEEAEDMDTAEWFDERRSEWGLDEPGSDAAPDLGQWPDTITPIGEPNFHFDFQTGTLKPEVAIGILTIQHPWHLPGMLLYDEWNDRPDFTISCALFRLWQKRFGARITGITEDAIECAVENPPATQQRALKLAWQHYLYCPGIITDRHPSIREYAAALQHARYWYFCWD